MGGAADYVTGKARSLNQGLTGAVLDGTRQPAAPNLPAGPGPAPDLTDDAVLQARRAAMRQLAAKRGLQSTFLTTPMAGSMLGGSGTGGPGSSS